MSPFALSVRSVLSDLFGDFFDRAAKSDVHRNAARGVVETLDDRRLFAFSAWSSIEPAIAKVPQSAGQLSNVSVVNFNTTVYTGPLNVTNTLNRIRADDGPDRSDDGSVYTNPQASGLPVDGTYYEFTVEPDVGTNINFTKSPYDVASPGPMRILLATGGDCYFTGDHYDTFTAVSIYGAATPTIGSFSVSPTSVTAGASATLTASNVTESGGTIASVKFYRESNGTSGLQTTGDTLIGTGTQSGTTWSISTSTTGFAAGSYTYYAVATDSGGTSSAASSTTLAVTAATSPNPVIGSFSVSPTSVTIGAVATLTASSVTDAGSTITAVKFYRESNGTSGLQTSGDTLIGTGTQSGTTWSISTSTSGFTAGTYTYYAVATDAASVSSAASSTTLSVTNPVTNGVIAGWDVSGQTNFGTQGLAAATVASGVTNSLGLTRGSGVGTSGSAASAAWGGTNWASTSSAGISGNEYASFGVTVSASSTLSLSSIDLHYRRSSSGPSNGLWQYELNGGSWVTIADVSSEFSSTSSSGASITELSLASIAALQNLAAGTAVDLRVVPYGSTSSGGTWYVYDQTGNDLVINGSIGASGQTAKAAAPAAAKSPFSTMSLEQYLLTTDA